MHLPENQTRDLWITNPVLKHLATVAYMALEYAKAVKVILIILLFWKQIFFVLTMIVCIGAERFS